MWFRVAYGAGDGELAALDRVIDAERLEGAAGIVGLDLQAMRAVLRHRRVGEDDRRAARQRAVEVDLVPPDRVVPDVEGDVAELVALGEPHLGKLPGDRIGLLRLQLLGVELLRR